MYSTQRLTRWVPSKSLVFGIAVAAVGLMMGASVPARATTLTSWTNSQGPLGPGGSYALSFTAGAAATTITFGGYNVPSINDVGTIGLFLNGVGPNLLGQTWTFTMAASGSDATQGSDGTSVNALSFRGVTIGSYDTYSQTIATIIGDSYTLDFIYSGPGSENGFFADASNGSPSAVPLPAALPLFATGLGALGVLGWRKKKKATAFPA